MKYKLATLEEKIEIVKLVVSWFDNGGKIGFEYNKSCVITAICEYVANSKGLTLFSEKSQW